MPKKSGIKFDEVKNWLNKVSYSDEVRKAADEKYGYTRALREYQGDYLNAMPSFLKETNLIPINEVYAFTKAFIASVYSRNPHVSFNAKGANSIGPSKILEMAVNGYWRELRLKNQIRRCIFDAIFAEGWMKVGYSAAFGSIESEDGEPPIEANEFIRNEEIFATRVSWKHIVRDPDAIDGIHDARWVAQRIIKPLDAVNASGLYVKDLKPTHTYTSDVPPLGDSRTIKQVAGQVKEDFLEYWEVWDMDTKKVYWVSDGCDTYMREPEKWPYRFDGYPFERLVFCDNADEAYAPNLICAWEPQLWEKIKIRSMQMDHIKRFNRQLWAKKGSVTKQEMEKFAMGRTGAINTYEGDIPPTPAQYPPLQTDIYAIEGRIDMDKDNISGQPNVIRSAPQKTQSRTLGELNTMVASFQARQNDPQGAVEDFCTEIAYKLAAVMKDYLSGDKFVRATQEDKDVVINSLGKDKWDGNGFRFDKSDIENAEFDAEVRVGSTLPLDRQGRMESLINLLKLGQTLSIMPGSEISGVIGKNLLSEMEMKEVEIAYQKMLSDMEKAKIIKNVAMKAQNALMQQKLQQAGNVMAVGEGEPQPAI